VQEHPKLIREGANIHVRAPITVSQAILGGNIKVPTLNGVVDVQIPPGTQPGEKLTLPGKGIPATVGSPGNQYIHWQVHIPTNLTKRQSDLMHQFGKDEQRQTPNSSQVLETVTRITKFFLRRKVK